MIIALLAGAFGLLIGSFLNVVVWRVPRGESVVRPPSACPACGAAIRPRDNLPVVGWLVLRGRCRDCGAAISARYPLVEAGTGLLFALVGLRFGAHAVLPAFLYLAAVSVALTLIDLDVKRLPDVLTLPSYGVGIVLLGLASLSDPQQLLRAVLGAAALFALYFALCFAYPAGMGFGDVKLSGVLGLYTAWLGWDVWASGVMAGFLLGGVFGIAVILSGRGGRKTALPFGPFMILGAFVAIFFGHGLVDGYLHLTTGG
ncbi:MAG: prepilin peptidase [Frankiales bacterium]|nr:prepilin peptidase [Frankiales bacterium]